MNIFVTYYADDSTPYIVENNVADVLEKLTNITQRFVTWFANNQVKANHGKCHLLLRTQEDANIQISNATINFSRSQSVWQQTEVWQAHGEYLSKSK